MEERFKDFPQLLDPDTRSRFLEVGPGSLEAFYRVISAIELNPDVPQAIRNHFVTAKHLAVYSWYVYTFCMVAQSHAYATLEFALRERLGHRGKDRPPTLRPLWHSAIKAGLLYDDGFRDWPGRLMQNGSRPPSIEWVSLIGESLAGLRNFLAHGSSSLYPQHWWVLQFVADAINQLYPQSSSP